VLQLISDNRRVLELISDQQIMLFSILCSISLRSYGPNVNIHNR
jgi:hypothetical protein